MSRRYGRFVDARVIRDRMDRKDRRVQREARRVASLRAAGLHSEVWPYASVEIVHAGGGVTVLYARPVPAIVEPAIVPADPDAPLAPVVDVQLVPKPDGGQ